MIPDFDNFIKGSIMLAEQAAKVRRYDKKGKTMKQIEIPKYNLTELRYKEPPERLVRIDYNDWQTLVSQIEAVNKQINNGVNVRSDNLKFTWAVEGSDFYENNSNTNKALLINIEPILEKKTKEEKAMELIEALTYLDADHFPREKAVKQAKAILEESEET